jgi:hypothetical protein
MDASPLSPEYGDEGARPISTRKLTRGDNASIARNLAGRNDIKRVRRTNFRNPLA